MAKEKTIYFCRECGTESSKWLGQCPGCREWNTMVEAPTGALRKTASGGKTIRSAASPKNLSEVTTEEEDRIGTGMKEMDRVLGGGIVRGSLVLASGDPGIGKSTLLLQMCRNLALAGVSVLYVSGEESLKQIKLRAVRIGDCPNNLLFLSETDMHAVKESILTLHPEVVIVDSVQTMVLPEQDSTPGSVTQIREITTFLMRLAKEEDISVFMVGHVTKEGTVAGPKMLEHMVDTVLYLEGDSTTAYRLLRTIKNRFGSTNEIGVFEMEANGLTEVENPSEHMLRGRPEGEPGSVVAVTMEGTRPILVEVQALVCRTNFNLPRRTAAGTDSNRMNLLMAVLEKRLGMNLSTCDAYLNVAGGMRITEPAIDLAIVLALISGYDNVPLETRTVAFGEVGLTGELRSVTQALQRIREAAKLGYKRCILSRSDYEKMKDVALEGIQLVGISNVRELKQILRK